MNQDQIDHAFSILNDLLNKKLLPTENGETRQASPDEFMLMNTVTQNGKVIQYDFKHRDSRRYVIVKMTAWGTVNGITITEWNLHIQPNSTFDYQDLTKFQLN